MAVASGRMCSHLAKNFFGISSNNIDRILARRLLSTPSAESNSTDNTEKTVTEGEADSQTVEREAAAKAEEAFKEEKDKLMKELGDTQDKYKRALAETENVRQRMKKQVDDAKLFGIQGFCKDLLEVADILGKATESVPKEELTNSNPHLKNLYEGLSMTDSELQKVFTRNGVARVNPENGEKFNPNFHEALFQIALAEGAEAGTVAAVTKIGYTLHSRTLRPALVGVFKDK